MQLILVVIKNLALTYWEVTYFFIVYVIVKDFYIYTAATWISNCHVYIHEELQGTVLIFENILQIQRFS